MKSVYLRRSEIVLKRSGFAVCCVLIGEVVVMLFSESLFEFLLIVTFKGEEIGIQQDIDAA